ncbi:MAG: hypothetical protein JNK82_15185 [Myxococcaceae bacterium]|nr:hypothetical protein [Myxococcaceae bacterium]
MRRKRATRRGPPTMFVAHMSHEMYGPLDPRQAKSLAAIRQSGEHLLALVNDLLDLSRIQSGALRFERAPVNVRELVDESVAVIAEHARQRGQTLEVKVGAAWAPWSALRGGTSRRCSTCSATRRSSQGLAARFG